MFRLIKLAAYALFGFALYEFFRGMSDARPGGGDGGNAGARAQQRGGERPQGAMGRNEGRPKARPQSKPGGQGGLIGSRNPQGMTVPTQDADGASITERVGRGVVSQ